MSDLTDIQAAQSVKIAGAASTGIESNFAGVTANLEVQSCDTLNNGGVNINLTVGTTATELKVGGARLVNRKMILIQPLNNGVFFGYSSAVTAANGMTAFNNQTIMLPVGENTQVWLIATAAGKDVRIGEIA